MQIRTATEQDLDSIREVHLSAFPAEERDLIAELATRLFVEDSALATLSLVAECDGQVVGHAAFSPVSIAGEETVRGFILAPLAVKPDFQGRGMGSQLIACGKKELEGLGIGILFVYGDPAYYGRFGFEAETAACYKPPYELQLPFGWQACLLNSGEIGESTREISCVAALSDPELW